MRYIIDVYDIDFNYIFKTSYYNSMIYNIAKIKNRKLYMLNIESDDTELKKQIGRFSVFNIPYKLNVYKITNEAYGKQNNIEDEYREEKSKVPGNLFDIMQSKFAAN